MPSVLVVEDSLTQSTQIRLMLKSAEFEVYVAENGREALKVLENHQPDVVLTDLQMPEMDGLELVQAIRDRYPHLPVVLMTQHGSEEIALDALRQGASSYLPKHQLQHHMIATLDDILESARQAHRQEWIEQRRFRTEIQYRLENDPAIIAPLSAHIEQELAKQHFANPTTRRQMGVALRKALDNAIFHGNLELGEEDRKDGELVYRDLAEQRRTKRPWCERNVWITVIIDEVEAQFIVRDEGPGFDVNHLPGFNGSANLDEMRGSGLLLIRTFMDLVQHNALGNEITMRKRRSAAGDADVPPQALLPSGTLRLFDAETVEDTLVITILTENLGFADVQLSVELNHLYQQLDHPDIRHVLIDFSRIAFFSSTVLETLRGIWLRIKERGGQMALCGLSPAGHEILHHSRFDTLWPLHPNRSAALMALHGRL
jgi:anti-anti-sigma factor